MVSNNKWITAGMSDRERVEHYSMPEPNTGCWIWIANHSRRTQYGLASKNGKSYPSHRLSYEAFVGTIPDGYVIDHLCRNPACVNPQHLEPVTQQINCHRSPISIPGINNAKTHCDQGHEFTHENVYVYPDGRRECRICSRKYKAKYKRKMFDITGRWV